MISGVSGVFTFSMFMFSATTFTTPLFRATPPDMETVRQLVFLATLLTTDLVLSVPFNLLMKNVRHEDFLSAIPHFGHDLRIVCYDS